MNKKDEKEIDLQVLAARKRVFDYLHHAYPNVPFRELDKDKLEYFFDIVSTTDSTLKKLLDELLLKLFQYECKMRVGDSHDASYTEGDKNE